MKLFDEPIQAASNDLGDGKLTKTALSGNYQGREWQQYTLDTKAVFVIRDEENAMKWRKASVKEQGYISGQIFD